MFLIFETLIVLKIPMWRVIYLSYTGNCEMMTGTTHDPYPAQRSKRIPQRARCSLAEGQHGVQAEAMSGSGHVCRGNRASWLLKITTWLLLAQHIQSSSVGKESVAWQWFSAPLWISLLILWNAMRLIYLPTPFLASLVRSWEAAW